MLEGCNLVLTLDATLSSFRFKKLMGYMTKIWKQGIEVLSHLTALMGTLNSDD